VIKGHGDDAYQYGGEIKTDFSSNISTHVNHEMLMHYLADMPQLVAHYPEPEAWSLEEMIAERLGIDACQVVVTSGATEAIYLIAQSFRMSSVVPSPSFSEYEDACNMFPAIDSSRSMLWLCNPNNPDGKVYENDYIVHMTKEYDIVVVDQSYEYYNINP